MCEENKTMALSGDRLALFYRSFDWYARTHGCGDIVEGKYACFSGANVIGFYDTPEDALEVIERLRLPPGETRVVTAADVERARAQTALVMQEKTPLCGDD